MLDTPWQVPYEATEDGPICYQPIKDPEHPPVMDEECLYMNIYRPSNVTSPLTTMLWVHGGGLTAGYGW
jgi:para-nitrobenzyl esterase